jgi:hypothetical protein
MREYQVRICERLGVQFPGPTRQGPLSSLGRWHGRSALSSGNALCAQAVTLGATGWATDLEAYCRSGLLDDQERIVRRSEHRRWIKMGPPGRNRW